MRPVRRSTAPVAEASSFMSFAPACRRTTLGPWRNDWSTKLNISEIVAPYVALSVVVVHIDRLHRSDHSQLVLIGLGDQSVGNVLVACSVRHIGINNVQNRQGVGGGESGDSEPRTHISGLWYP